MKRHPSRLFTVGLTAACGGLLLFAFMSAVLRPHAQADIGDAEHIGFRVLRFIGGEWKTTWNGPDWITRNLVDGTKIPVCSSVFPEATKEAIKRWHDALGPELLEWTESGDCNPGELDWNPREGIVGLTVSRGVLMEADEEADRPVPTFSGAVFTDKECRTTTGKDPNDVHACAQIEVAANQRSQQEQQRNEQWQSYHGRAEVVFNPNVFCRDISTAKSLRCSVNQSDYNLVENITHEIGHVLGLADYFCGLGDTMHEDYLPSTGIAANRTVMNSWTAIPECNAFGGRPTMRDKNDYRSIYLPAPVKNVLGSADDQSITVLWNPFETFVESGFEVQRADGDNWVKVATVQANASSAWFSSTQAGVSQAADHRYRVVSRTMALPVRQGAVTFGYVDDDTASEQVTITVRLSKPALRVTAGTGSVALHWDEVIGADGYDVRLRRTTDSNCEASADQEASKNQEDRSHTFGGLTASTSYLVCARATVAANSDATSDWRKLFKSTSANVVVDPVTPTGVDCLSSQELRVLITWRSICAPTTAAVLLPKVVAEITGATGIWMWDGSVWRLYARFDDQLVPGSINFSISGGDVLWLIAATSIRADGAWNPPPTPTAAELKRLAELAAQ